MIDQREINAILEDKLLDSALVNLYLYENRKTANNPISVYDLNIDREIIQQIRTIAKQYLQSVLDLLKAGELKQIPPYNPDQEQEIFKIESRDVNQFVGLDDYLSGRKPRIPYNRKTVQQDKLKAWIFRFEAQLPGRIEQILFFQRFQPARMIGAKSVAIFESAAGFKLVKDNFLNFNLDMDLFGFQDTLVVTKAFAFESMFGYEDYYKNSATKLVEKLKDNLVAGLSYGISVPDFPAVSRKIRSNSRVSRKLCSAHVNGYYRSIDFEKLTDLNKKYKLALNLNAAKKEWVIDEEMDLQVMARVLNDDYERSQITNNEYIATGKEVIR
jgi:hypothetical protein